MDKKPSTDIMRISFKLYEILGETFDGSTGDTSTRLRIFRFFTCSILVLNFILAIGSFTQVKGEVYIHSLEDTMSILHNFVKYACFLYYKEDIKKLINEMKYFWNYQRCGIGIQAKINNVHSIVEKCQKFLLLGPIYVAIAFSLRPIFNKENKFIFYIWAPWNSKILDAFFLFTHYFVSVFLTSIIFGCDFLFLSYSVHVASQIYLLNCELKNLQVKNCNRDICEYIKHHQLMLSVFDQMKNIFFWLLLFHYFVSLLSGCSQMYLIMLGKSKPIDLLAIGIYFCCIFIEFAYYSFPVEIIVSELRYISTAIYMSPWFEMNLARKKLLLLIMMRAQRQGYLSMGGIMDMNVDAFGSVVRKVFSFCAILKNILNT